MAEWFSGEALEPGADSIINQMLSKTYSEYLRMEHWENEDDLDKLLEKILVDELNLTSIQDITEFDTNLGGSISGDFAYFNFKQAVEKIESWQILTPVREKVYGVRLINRKIHKLFRDKTVKFASSRGGKIPSPLGIEELVYGDKVINLYNSRRKDVWPKEDALNYIANGEIGIVIGQFKRKTDKFIGKPWNTEIEFSSQKGFKYSFFQNQFNDEGDSPLELAYALTVHKAQGSEFGKVILVIPNPCFILSRELLYTALTRQKEKVILLYQGSVFDVKKLASPQKSEVLKRITNLFIEPDLIESEDSYLEKNLIHQATDGEMLRSKSELLIYQELLKRGLKPSYERKLEIDEVQKLPDFTIENENTGETFYWEHLGLLHIPEYRKRWEEKYNWYRDNKILPFEEGGGENGTLIVSMEKPIPNNDGSRVTAFSMKEIEEIIKKVFNL